METEILHLIVTNLKNNKGNFTEYPSVNRFYTPKQSATCADQSFLVHPLNIIFLSITFCIGLIAFSNSNKGIHTRASGQLLRLSNRCQSDRTIISNSSAHMRSHFPISRRTHFSFIPLPQTTAQLGKHESKAYGYPD